ncbi:MAG: SAM-dependent methyltransferase [Holophagales bacterium]|nr:SAM-dependent methyltransferase [Holophagales bacterium]
MPLQEILREQLSKAPMPASEFMNLALYHPEHGYYRRRTSPWGFDGKDYYTALDLGPLLGEAIAERLRQTWLSLDRPCPFTVFEPGAGRGWLGRDILNAATKDFAECLRYIHCDDSPVARAEAAKALEPWLNNGSARFVNQDDEAAGFTGAVISNELFDALPAQPWRWDGGRWRREELVELGDKDDAACTRWEPADPFEAGDWFGRCAEGGLQPEDGSVWAIGLPAILGRICKPLLKGLFLTIDYGDTAAKLIAKGADIRRYRGHTVDGAWWADPGESDLTADVDFTRLARLLEGLGLQVEAPASLGRWIRAHAPLVRWEEQWRDLTSATRAARTQNLMQLTHPSAMGDRFKVLTALGGSASQ